MKQNKTFQPKMINRTKQAFWGVAADIFWHSVLILGTLIATPIILQFISKSLYGFWIVSLSVLGYLGMLDLSIGMALTHYIARLSHERESNALEQVVNTAFFSFICIGILVLAIGWSISSYVPLWLHISLTDSASVILAFRIIVIGSALSLPLATFGALITGSQRMAVAIAIQRTTALTGIVLSIVLLYFGVGLIALALSQVFTVIMSGLINYLFCKYIYFPRLKISIFSIKKYFGKKLLSFGGYLQLGRVANTVSLSTDAIIIAVIFGSSTVPIYSFTSKLVMLVGATLISKLPSALFPALSQMYAEGNVEKIRACFVRLASYSIRIAFVFCIFLLIGNRRFVTLWVGSEFYGGNALNLVFIYWLLIDALYRGTGVVIQASGDLKKWSIISIAEALLNISISLALIKSMGLIGIALGTAISRTISCSSFLMLICGRNQLPVRLFLWKGVLSPMLKSIPSCCALLVFAFFAPPTMGWTWMSLIGLAGIITNILSFEGLELSRPSNIPIKERFRNIFLLEPI